MPTERRSAPHDAPRSRRGPTLRNPGSYHEGETAGLAEAMRVLATAGPVEACTALHEALTLWTHRANSLSASPSPALRAYHQGGRDALQAFVDAQLLHGLPGTHGTAEPHTWPECAPRGRCSEVRRTPRAPPT